MKGDKQRQTAFGEWKKASLAFLKQWPSGWATPTPEVTLRMKDTNEVAGTNFSVQPDASISLQREPKQETKVALRLSNMRLAAIRLEIVPQGCRKKKSTKTQKTQ